MAIDIISTIYQFLIAALLSFLLIAAILPVLREKLLDNPNQRSSHNVPIPRGAGIAFVIVCVLLNFIFISGPTRWLPALCMPLALVGIIDDHRDLPAIWRYLAQALTAIVLLHIGRFEIPLWAIPFCIVIITGIINLTNFMDGLDGLLGGCAVLLMAAASQWYISGAIFGFLIWNWSPAKVFMGDVGSTFIGAIFAGLILQESTTYDAMSLLLLGFPLMGDGAICLIRRLLSRRNIFSPHRQHLYQRLNRAGWKHSKIAMIYIVAVLLLNIARAIGDWPLLTVVILGEFTLAIILDCTVAIRFEES